MKYIKNSVIAFAVVVVTLVFPISSQAQKDVKVVNAPSEPVPVRGTINVGNIVHILPSLPPGAFSITALSGGAITLSQDPEGTSYAITSLTVANGHTDSAAPRITAVFGNDCLSPAAASDGPLVVVPGRETVHLSFPQPFVLPAQPGAVSCLRVTSSGPAVLAYTVVGYRF